MIDFHLIMNICSRLGCSLADLRFQCAFQGGGASRFRAQLVLALIGSILIGGLTKEAVAGSISAEVKRPKNTVVATIPIGPGAYTGLAISPDSQSVYVANGQSIVVINANTNQIASTFTIPHVAIGLAITPDGSSLYCAAGDTLYQVSTATMTLTKHFPTGQGAFSQRLARMGRRFMFRTTTGSG
jgi:hypothetical protein